jgi:hypothetical protein
MRQIIAAMTMLEQLICELYVTVLSLNFRYDAREWQVLAALFMLFYVLEIHFKLCVTLLSFYLRYDAGKWQIVATVVILPLCRRQIVAALFMLKQIICELYVTVYCR